MMILNPASVSVLNEPYEKGLAQFNREYEAMRLEEHAKKLAAASRGRRFVRWLRRALCGCLEPFAGEVPPPHLPFKVLPMQFHLRLDGQLFGTEESRRAIMKTIPPPGEETPEKFDEARDASSEPSKKLTLEEKAVAAGVARSRIDDEMRNL